MKQINSNIMNLTRKAAAAENNSYVIDLLIKGVSKMIGRYQS
ncbi:hypothetical protein D918_03093 [Trichuris suis]|nr:hypothetical protein D918_03093 [Trichuris suis]